MIRSFLLTALACFVAGAEARAQRVLDFTVEQDGKVVLRSQYLDDGTAKASDAWRDNLQAEPRAEPEIAEITPINERPLRAHLKGSIVLTLKAGDETLASVKLEELRLVRKTAETKKWHLETNEVYRAAFDARLSDDYVGTTYFKRLTDPFSFRGKDYPGENWWFVLVPVLAIGALFVVWMYIKDSQSISWYFAVLLGIMRATVYGLLAYMFLLPTFKETRNWKPRQPPMLEERSRVVLLLDVSDSMGISDDPSTASNRTSRLKKVIEYITDENVVFMRKLLENNPVYIYRFATRLDNEVHAFTLGPKDAGNPKGPQVPTQFAMAKRKDTGAEEVVKLAPWGEQDWINFVTYTDFKSWLTHGLSKEGAQAVVVEMGEGVGNAEWAEGFQKQSVDEMVMRMKLEGPDATAFRGNFNNLLTRVSLARTITKGTNVTDSVRAAFESERRNRLEGIIVFSDGRSNVGADARAGKGQEENFINPAIEDLYRQSKKDNIPIISVGIGQVRVIKKVRITDLQAPDQTVPDDAYKILVEIDGENLTGVEIPVFLEMFPPDSTTPFLLPSKVTFDRGDPPHGQAKWTIDPAKILDLVSEEDKALVQDSLKPLKAGPPEFKEGAWKVRAFTPKISEEGKPDPKAKIESDLTTIRVEKKSVRALVMCAAPNRDFQFLLNQLMRDKADVSVYVQNDAGQFLDGKSITYLDDKYRHLKEFPNRLVLGDEVVDKPEAQWLNLAKYDVIIAFDPDWTLLTAEQCRMIDTWILLQAGGLLHVAGPINTKKMTYPENIEKLKPLLECFPVELADYDQKMAAREQNKPRRLEFPGVAPDFEFLRLDDNFPDELISGWEPFFTGRKTREEAMNAELKNGFYDYYPIKRAKVGSTIVARYMEPNVADNTFDKQEPPYLVTYKYGQGYTALLGSSEMWRMNKQNVVFFERFWVKMSRFLASGSRKKQSRRGRILMSKNFAAGDTLRITAQLLDANSKGLPASERPQLTIKPDVLDSYATIEPKKDGPKVDADPEVAARKREEYHQSLTRILRMDAQTGKGEDDPEEGYFQLENFLAAKDYPPGVWRVEIKIPNSSETLSQKFIITKSLPPELNDVRPDMFSLAAISADVEDLKPRFTTKLDVFEKLRDRAFTAPNLVGKRMAFNFDDQKSLDLIPECMRNSSFQVQNPMTEPEYEMTRITPRWFNGPELPRGITSWYDRSMNQPERTHTVALWMLVCIGLLSLEWLTRKLLKLA